MFSNLQILTPQFQRFERVIMRKGRWCPHCGAQHWDARFKMCCTCRALNAAQTAQWREGQRRQGLCTNCVVVAGEGSTWRCAYHLEYDRNLKARLRREHARMGLCHEPHCNRQPLPGRAVCQQHAEARPRQSA